MKKFMPILLLIAFIFTSINRTSLSAAEIIKIPVADGYELTADYYEGIAGGSAAFILHQCTPGHGRSKYLDASSLNSTAEKSLAILSSSAIIIVSFKDNKNAIEMNIDIFLDIVL